MDGFFQGDRPSFFSFVHLHDEKLHGFPGDFVDLLAHSAGWNNGLAGDRRIVKTDETVIVGKSSIFPHDQIKQHIGMSIVRHENSLSFSGIFFFQSPEYFLYTFKSILITVPEFR